jgi:hypothetical protein
MSTKLLALASDLSDTNPAGAQLIVSLTNAETAADIVEALDAYDVAVTEVNTVEPTLEPVAFWTVNTPNWQHNSGKHKNPRGISKGKIKSRKQALQALKLKLNVK